LTKGWGAKTGSTRATIASVAICLLVLKVLVLVPFQSGGALDHWSQGARASVLAVDCDKAGAPENGKTPGSTSHHHDACAFCLVRDHAAALDAAIPLATLEYIVPHAASTMLGRTGRAASRAPCKGWGDACSPRGPPIFS
jgi:hypothetical protein